MKKKLIPMHFKWIKAGGIIGIQIYMHMMEMVLVYKYLVTLFYDFTMITCQSCTTHCCPDQSCPDQSCPKSKLSQPKVVPHIVGPNQSCPSPKLSQPKVVPAQSCPSPKLSHLWSCSSICSNDGSSLALNDFFFENRITYIK